MVIAAILNIVGGPWGLNHTKRCQPGFFFPSMNFHCSGVHHCGYMPELPFSRCRTLLQFRHISTLVSASRLSSQHLANSDRYHSGCQFKAWYVYRFRQTFVVDCSGFAQVRNENLVPGLLHTQSKTPS